MNSRLLRSVSIFAAAVAFGVPAKAGELIGTDSYVQVFGGWALSEGQSSYYEDIYDQVLHDGFVVGAAIGSHVGEGLRSELELSYVRNENDATDYDESDLEDYELDYDGHTSTVFLLGNLWKDFNLGAFRPYVGGGLGVGFLTNDGTYDSADYGWDDTGVGIAAQVGVGARFSAGERIVIDGGYRLRAVVDATFDDIGVDENGGSANSMYSHTLQLGAAYAFNGAAMPEMAGDANWYASLFGGAVIPDDNGVWSTATNYSFEGKAGFSVGVALGTRIADDLRAELELSYLNYQLESGTDGSHGRDPASGNLNSVFFLANVWQDFHLGALTPYIGGGFGFASTSIDDGELDGDVMSDRSGLSLAGQAGLGVRYGMTDRTELDFGYRFKSIVEAKILRSDGDDFDNAELASNQHVLQAGVTYNAGPLASIQPTADVTPVDSHYVSLFGGAVFPLAAHIASNSSNYIAEFNTGYTIGAAVGTSLTERLRGEVELSYTASDVETVTDSDSPADDRGNDVAGTYLMANLWHDMSLLGLTPYIGGGVGVALMDVDVILDKAGDRIDSRSLALALQVGGGIRFDLTERLTLDAGYRFKSALGVVTEPANDDYYGYGSYYTQIAQLGAAWKF